MTQTVNQKSAPKLAAKSQERAKSKLELQKTMKASQKERPTTGVISPNNQANRQ